MGTLAAQLAASPGQIDETLATHGLDRARFDAAMYDIAADPDATAAFEAARR